MNQIVQDALKGLKDGMMGLVPMLMPLLFPGMGAPVKIMMIVSGVVVMALGVLTNTVQKDFGPLDTWGKVLKDFILSASTSMVPIIQNGASSETGLVIILMNCAITALSVFANVISNDVTANTLLAKVAKDFAVLGVGAVTPIFTAAITSGQSIGLCLGAVAVALLSVLANVIKTDVLAPALPPNK